MINALIIVFREGFEAFLTVAIIFAYLRKTGRDWLRPTVYAGIVVSVFASFALGFWLRNVNSSMWEGVLGIVAAVLVATFVIHMWRTAPRMKRDMETRLEAASSKTSRLLAVGAVFGFTVLHPRLAPRHRLRRGDVVGLGALRTPHQHPPLLPGDRHLPAAVHGADPLLFDS